MAEKTQKKTVNGLWAHFEMDSIFAGIWLYVWSLEARSFLWDLITLAVYMRVGLIVKEFEVLIQVTIIRGVLSPCRKE